MIAVQRLSEIKEMVLREKAVKVSELARRFDVSEETIRRDLGKLEKEGFVQKNYGGAILVKELQVVADHIRPIEKRKFELFREKDAIGQRAARFVDSPQTIIMDSGSTTWCVAQHLPRDIDISVVTNSIDVAEALELSEGSQVVLIGGRLNRKSMSLVGPSSEKEIRKYSADIGFIGVSGFSMSRGFMSSDIYDAEIKKAMVQTAERVIVVADHTKFSVSGLTAFCGFSEVDVVVTDWQTDREVVVKLEEKGIEVIVCPQF